PLLDAYHDGVTELGPPFAGWAAACLTAIDAASLVKQFDRGFAGLQLPATAVADESGYRWCSPLLDVLAERDLPLFIHPAPAAGANTSVPAWWAALVPSVQHFHAACIAFRNYPGQGSDSAPLAGRPSRGCESALPPWRAWPRCMASAWPRVAVPARWRGVRSIRACSLRPQVTATAPWTPCSACSASTCSYSAQTGRMHSRIPISALAALPAMRSAQRTPRGCLPVTCRRRTPDLTVRQERSDDNDLLRASCPVSRPARAG